MTAAPSANLRHFAIDARASLSTVRAFPGSIKLKDDLKFFVLIIARRRTTRKYC
jgi:hypothetical protein